MDKRLDEVELTIFDTETTGLEPGAGDRIVEIAAIRIRGNEKIGIFQSLVNPQRKISDAAFAVNRITEEMLKGAPAMEIVMPKFLTFVQGSYLCSYNAAFDLEFLNNELKLSGKNILENIVAVDILKMARRLMPGLERYSLWFVSEKLGIKAKQEHRALSDVELAFEAFKRFKNTLEEKGILDFKNFINLFGLNSGLIEDINNQKIAQIQQAMDLGVKLKIKYLSCSDARVSDREVIPKEFKKDKQHTYLLGHCCLRNEERTFRIDSILHLRMA